MKMAELKVMHLDESVQKAEPTEKLAEAAANCERDPHCELSAKKGPKADQRVGRGFCTAGRTNATCHGRVVEGWVREFPGKSSRLEMTSNIWISGSQLVAWAVQDVSPASRTEEGEYFIGSGLRQQ
ncbi:UNVERIFIED_CONTAM: hypothetical protein PYX00_001928 [Menopon gallinae]|uniref:Uncharacterized protein n=1 Tax=Menopon gallinae TaxID=328185 RepID=A0AAW2IGF6_9NEOP